MGIYVAPYIECTTVSGQTNHQAVAHFKSHFLPLVIQDTKESDFREGHNRVHTPTITP
jgi:hypothetical protein